MKSYWEEYLNTPLNAKVNPPNPSVPNPESTPNQPPVQPSPFRLKNTLRKSELKNVFVQPVGGAMNQTPAQSPSPAQLNFDKKPGGGLLDMEWGIRQQQRQETDRLLNMSDQEFNQWLQQNQSNRPGGWASQIQTMRNRKKAGIPPGAVPVPDQWMEGKGWIKGGWRLPGGQIWDPSKGPAPEPRTFPWNTPQEAPKKDWEAIDSFLQTVNFRKGINVNRALQYPDMVNQSISGNITIKNLTPALKTSLESQGYKIKTYDFDKTGNLGSINLGSGVEALNALEKLKAAGADTELQRFQNVSFRGG